MILGVTSSFNELSHGESARIAVTRRASQQQQDGAAEDLGVVAAVAEQLAVRQRGEARHRHRGGGRQRGGALQTLHQQVSRSRQQQKFMEL